MICVTFLITICALALVASDAGLFAVVLGSDAVQQLSDHQGVAAQPVRVGSCNYGAWAAVKSTWYKKCSNGDELPDTAIAGANATAHLVFRVNQDNVAINSTGDGGIWAEHAGRLVKVGNWGDLQGDKAKEASTDSGLTGAREAQRTCADLPAPPVATDDARIGVRAVPTVFDVLYNDSDPNCEPIAVSTVTVAPGAPGIVSIVDNGQHLLFTPSSELRDGKLKLPLAFTLTYTDADSAGMTSAPATATIVVADPSTNSPPELRKKPDGSAKKMQTAVESGKLVSYNVLDDFWDPDGDPIRLVSASADAGAGEVTSSPGGIVRYGAYGVQSGIENVNVRVSDGQATNSDATAQLEVTVLPQGQAIKPIAKDDFITVFEGKSGTTHPLANDSDGNGTKLSANFASLTSLPAGLTASYDSQLDSLTVTGVTAGVYAIPYQATDGGDAAKAIVRVVVTKPPAVNAAPIAVPDRVVVRPGRVVNVDVLTNDIDPDGDLLAVVSASAGGITPDGGGVKASVIDRRIVQIELVAPTTGGQPVGPFFVSYSIDDGKSTAQVSHVSIGLLTVFVDPTTADQPPIAVKDSVTVRTGDVASVAVVANDIDPDGGRIVLDSVKADEAAKFQADGGGVVWTDKQLVRVRGGKPGSYVLHYVATANNKQESGELTVTVTDVPSATNLNQAAKPKDLELRAARGSTERVAIPLDGIDPDGDSVKLTSVGPTDGSAQGTTVQTDPVDPTRLLYSTTPLSAVTSDSFTYTVTDAYGLTSSAVVKVVIVDVTRSSPVAHDDVMRARPGRVVLIPVLANDVDANDDKLSLAAQPFMDANGIATDVPLHPDAVSVVADVAGGAVTGGRIQVVTPFADQPAISERYRITDGANFDSAYVRVIPDPTAPNLPPITQPISLTADEIRGKKTIDVDVSKVDSDPDDANATLTASLPKAQSMPGVTATASGSVVSITLIEKPQVIVYLVTDSDPVAPASTYGIIRVPGSENHPPVLTAFAKDPANFAVVASPPTAVTLHLSDLVEDPDQDPGVLLTNTEITSSTGTVSRIDGKTFTFTPNPSPVPYTAQVTFEVEDRPGDSTSKKSGPLTISLPVSPGNTPPIFLGAGDVKVPQLDEPVTYDLAPLMQDDPKDTLQFVLTGKPAGFTIVQTGSKLTITSTDKTVAVGATFAIRFTATDGVAGHDPVAGSLNVSVIATNRGRPVAANIGPIAAVRGTAAAGVNVIAQATNPFPKEQLTIESVTASGGGSVGCSSACGQSPVVFTPTQPGTFTITYVIKDAVGQVANGTIVYVVKGRPLLPGVPQIGSVGDKTVNLTWSDADMQGGTLVKYVITAVETGQKKESTTPSVAFDGLENAKTFHFTVYAVNEIPGNGDVSGQSNGAIPDRVPDPPINVRITDYHDGQLTLQWDPPTSAGNYSPITAYEVNLAGFGITPISGPITQLVQPGLTNGVTYTFTVRAKNAATTNGGWGASSNASAGEKPSRYPDPPTAVVAVTAGDGGSARVKVTWAAPAVDGGRAITSYKVCRVQIAGDCLPGDASRQVTFPAATGSDNSFTVIAYNSDKNKNDSTVSLTSNVVQGIVTPGAPTITAVTPEDHRLTVIATPGTNGGCSTTFIEYALNTGAWQPSNVFTGLSNGTPYTATARMTLGPNCVVPAAVARSSSTSNAVPQTPYGALGQPSVTSTLGDNNRAITWSWNANQGDNGRAWQMTVSGECAAAATPGSGSQSGSCTITPGFSSGSKTVTIAVVASNVAAKTATSTNATPPPPPLQTPTISSSVNGTTITWNWNANQPSTGTPNWTATIGGTCGGNAGPGNPTGSCSSNVGYSATGTVTITVTASGLNSTSASSSASTASNWRLQTTGPNGSGTFAAPNTGNGPLPRIGGLTTVTVICRTTGAPVGALNDTWWYALGGAFSGRYAPADNFYNNGATSGNIANGVLVDNAVPGC